MISPPTESEAEFRYELRRRLAVVHAAAELLIADPDGSLTDGQRDSIEDILTASNELSALVAHDPESGDGGQPAGEGGESTTPTPAVTGSDRSETVVLVSETYPFVDTLAEQFEQSGFDTRVVSSDREIEPFDRDSAAADTDRHVVLDIGVLPDPPIDSLTDVFDRLEDSESIVIVSTIDDSELPAPFLGISGVLSPQSTLETITDVLEMHHLDPTDSPRVAVATMSEGDDLAEQPFVDTLERLGCVVDTVSVADLLEYVSHHPVDSVFLSTDGFEAIDETALMALRTPIEGQPVPVVVVGPTPRSREWLAVSGCRVFAHRSLTAVELAGEILLEIEPECQS